MHHIGPHHLTLLYYLGANLRIKPTTASTANHYTIKAASDSRPVVKDLVMVRKQTLPHTEVQSLNVVVLDHMNQIQYIFGQ